jgi:DHA2 family multidrug resistance protein
MIKSKETSRAASVPLRDWIAVYATIIGAFMAVLDIQITNASLQDITGALSSTLDEGSWIATAYLVAEIVVIPLTAWLGQVFSLRRYLLINSALFLLFSVGCAFAHSLNTMIFFRALQGFTGGVMIPVSISVIKTKLPASKQPIGLALFGLTATFAPAIGPTLGGWLTDHYGWQSIFYMNLLPGMLMLVTLWKSMDREPAKWDLLQQADWWGIATMSIGLSSLTIFLEEGNRNDWFGSKTILWLAITSAVCLVGFVPIELMTKKPLLNLRLLRKKNFGFASVTNFTIGLALYGSIYLLPLYLAQLKGYNAMQIGETLMWIGAPQLLLLPFVPKLMEKIDLRIMISTGVLLFAASCYMNVFMSHDTAGDQLRWSLLVRALGQPMIMIPLSSIITAEVPKEQIGSASSLFNVLRNLGGSTGIALLATMLTRREQVHSLRIGESVTPYTLGTHLRLSQLQHSFMLHGSDAATAAHQAVAAVDQIIRREAFVMAYNDCFLALAIALAAGGFCVWFTSKVNPTGGAAEAH